MAEAKTQKITLWDGYDVTLNTKLLKDADFLNDYSEAQSKSDFKTITYMTVALVGGDDTDKVYNDIREYIIEKRGFFDVDAFAEILSKIGNALPKAAGRVQQRSWKTTR